MIHPADNQKGTVIGEVAEVSSDTLDIVVGGWRDAWGFIDFSGGTRISVLTGALAYSAPRTVGTTMVALPTMATVREEGNPKGTSVRIPSV